MDYSKLSDFEINKLVAEAQGLFTDNGWGFIDSDGNVVCCDDDNQEHRVNYCNTPAEAWPIIQEIWKTLNTVVDYDFQLGFGVSRASLWEAKTHMTGGNPLRAAMIVYLMMKETK